LGGAQEGVVDLVGDDDIRQVWLWTT